MSINKYTPHVIILPEDDANRQIAVGFAIQCKSKQLRIEKEIGGWAKVVDRFLSNYVGTMRDFPGRNVILLIDCDGQPERIADIRAKIPQDVEGRTFVLGCLSEPEDLKKGGLGSFENIGLSIAEECNGSGAGLWDNALLSHNAAELGKLRTAACGILWP